MANRLSKIVTRTGDNGTTGLTDGSRVEKNSARIHDIGSVNELNSHLGVLLAETLPQDVYELLLRVQNDLFDLGGSLAYPAAPFMQTSSRTWTLPSRTTTQTCHHSRNLSCPGAHARRGSRKYCGLKNERSGSMTAPHTHPNHPLKLSCATSANRGSA